MTLEKMNHRKKDYLGQKTKPTWSLLEDKVENKLFFSYDGDLFPPLTSNGKNSCYYGSSIPKPVELPVGHSKQKAPFEVRSGVRNLTIRELGQIEELVEPADHVRSAVTQFGRLVPPSGSQRLPASLALGPLHFAACGGTGHLKPPGPLSGENHLLSNGKEAYYYGSPIPKSAESPARHSQPKALMPASLALGPLHFAACGGTGHLKPPGPLSGDKYSYSLLPQPHCGWKSNGHDPPPWIDETFSDWLLS